MTLKVKDVMKIKIDTTVRGKKGGVCLVLTKADGVTFATGNLDDDIDPNFTTIAYEDIYFFNNGIDQVRRYLAKMNKECIDAGYPMPTCEIFRINLDANAYVD